MLCHVGLFVTPWTVARPAPLSVEFSRQECWSELPLPTPGDLPQPRIEPVSPALTGEFFTIAPSGKPNYVLFSKGTFSGSGYSLNSPTFANTPNRIIL